MEGGTFTGHGNGSKVDNQILQTYQKNFVQVQSILDHNRVLINEINQNQDSRIPDNLSRNVGLIRELNDNVWRVFDLYADISNSFIKPMDASPEGSNGKATQKRIRPY
ncbi:hypothetical protein J5N97_000157 [Dioscorea zingiberensis]|uniref:Protein EARLY FLOWERING 4 domain-containing protein n=1 Tax=Dioscorea zingiberensis TaxID=325984 RepID=A0A9D5BSQ2_9LILI|nr:hypothetical protein J5N97_000157 [Dioscorea zingiberensis]